MRSKSTQLWEEHIEKAVLGILVIVLLVVLFLGLTGTPNQVEVRVSGQSQSLSPAELNEAILAEASKVRKRQTPDAMPMEEPPSIDDVRMLTPEVSQILSGGVISNDSYQRSAPVVASSLVSSGTVSDLLYRLPALPSVRMVGVEQFLDEFTEAALERNPGLSKFTEPSSREIDWVTPVVSIDMAQTRSEFDAGTAEQPAAPAFWRDSMYAIVDIQFERQMMNSDGSWTSEAELVPVFLETINFRTDLGAYAQAIKDSSSGKDAVEEAQESLRNAVIPPLSDAVLQTELLQPMFAETEFGASDQFLLDPGGHSGRGDGRIEVIELEIKIMRMKQRAAKVTSELEKLGGPLEEQKNVTGGDGKGSGRGGRGGRGGGGGGGGFGGEGGGLGGSGGGRVIGGGSDLVQTERITRQRINKTRQLKQLNNQISSLLESLAELDPENSLLFEDAGANSGSRLVNLSEDVEVFSWTHDPSIQPGATYRYRAVVSFYNPFFTRGFQLDPQQEYLGLLPTLDTAVSDWSSPIQVDAGTEFFLTEATPPSGNQLGEAVIEVFSKQGGRYWSRSFTVQPGDRIGGLQKMKNATKPVDFGTEWYVLDILTDGSGDPSGEGIQVVLQEIGGNETLIIKHPAQESVNPVFKAMELKVQNADARDRGDGEDSSKS